MDGLKNIHYDAFISYRHLEPDACIANSIHKKLEAYTLPASVKKKISGGKTKISRVFRDTEELPLSDNLSDPINQALENSDYLICMCSPRYLESVWCMQEIRMFLQTHDRTHVLLVLVEGEPKDSFPEVLTYEEITETSDDGSTHTVRREIEPLAADVRGESRGEIKKKLDTAILRLWAAIFSLNYDDLRQRHREARLKRIIALSGAIGGCFLAVAVFAVITLMRISSQSEEISRQNREISKQNIEITDQNHMISSQYDELQDRYAGQMAVSAEKLLKKGRRKDAVYALRSVLPDSAGEKHNIDALRSLYGAMNTYGIDDKYMPVMTYDTEFADPDFDVSYDGRYILLYDGETLEIFDAESGERIRVIGSRNDTEEYALTGCFCGSEGITVIDGDHVKYYSISDQSVEKELDKISVFSSLFTSPDGKMTLAFDADSVFGIDNMGDIRYEISCQEIFHNKDSENASVSFDDGRFAIAFSDYDTNKIYIMVADEETGKVVYTESIKCR
ncbi:MAG: toll/interleukin-1 receptor domain-containing protein, partial [Eubacterium sp.]|nr:toll/interleukin-1 receptor domain-containing protein [Eubacterium sp.]